MGSNKQNIDKFAMRLWRYTCLRAAGAPDLVLKEGADLVKSSIVGFDPVTEHSKISSCLFDHIFEHTSQFYEPPFCLTCRRLADCVRQKEGTSDCCDDYLMDSTAYETCRGQLFRAVKLLDGVFGFDANRMVLVLNRLLDDMLSREAESHTLQVQSRS